jgi:SPP1 family predicted phage head-tail adaptor
VTIYDVMREVGPKLIDRFKNDNTIAHQQKTNTPDGAGGNAVVWNTVATFSGAVVPMSGNEVQQLARLNVKVDTAFYLKNADGSTVNVDDRFLFLGRLFTVRWNKNPAEGDAVRRILCEEGAE